MRKLLALPLLVALTLPSCATVQSARDKLTTMPEVEYQELLVKVERAGNTGGEKLAELLEDRTNAALAVTRNLRTVVVEDRLDIVDVVKGIVDEFGGQLGLEEQHLDYIRDGAKAIDAAVGQIRLGIDGKLTEREKGLIVALLDGLERGLQ